MGAKILDIPADKNARADRNRKKYHIPPKIYSMKAVIKKSKMSIREFERTFGIPEKGINKVFDRKRHLPAWFWHIFYEFDDLVKMTKKTEQLKIAEKELEVSNSKQVSSTNKNRIDEYRQRLAQGNA